MVSPPEQFRKRFLRGGIDAAFPTLCSLQNLCPRDCSGISPRTDSRAEEEQSKEGWLSPPAEGKVDFGTVLTRAFEVLMLSSGRTPEGPG